MASGQSEGMASSASRTWGKVAESAAGLGHDGRDDLGGEQLIAAGSEQGAQDPDRATRFEGRPVTGLGKSGHGERVFTLLVPAALEPPGIGTRRIDLFEVPSVGVGHGRSARRSSTGASPRRESMKISSGCHDRRRTGPEGSRTLAGPGPSGRVWERKAPVAHRLRARRRGDRWRRRDEAQGMSDPVGSAQCQAQTR